MSRVTGLRKNSKVLVALGAEGTAFLAHAIAGISRLLPHTELAPWTQTDWADPGATWTSHERQSIRIQLSFGTRENGSGISTELSRLRPPTRVVDALRTLDPKEHDLCNRFARRVSAILHPSDEDLQAGVSLRAILPALDGHVVSEFLAVQHRLHFDVGSLLGSLQRMSQQTYENKSLAFGCVVEPGGRNAVSTAQGSLQDYLDRKRYRALSDGYTTAYVLNGAGELGGFVDLAARYRRPLRGAHWYPLWADHIARASQGGLSISLTRSGDILIFEEGTLRFSFRFGRWQYWNHGHIVEIMKRLARVQRVPPGVVGRVVASVYRAALDVSFRRTGGLFVVLRKGANLRNIVRRGDGLDDEVRDQRDANFDHALPGTTVHGLPPRVLSELAGLDGAVVLTNQGEVRAYGAVLSPKKKGSVRRSEGARTAAAIGASHYGLAVKVSSDGDISVFYGGRRIVELGGGA